MHSASTDRMVSARSLDRGQSSSSPSLHPGIVIATRPGGLDGDKSSSPRICKQAPNTAMRHDGRKKHMGIARQPENERARGAGAGH